MARRTDFTAVLYRAVAACATSLAATQVIIRGCTRDFFDKLIGAIVAFEMPIETIAGKFKLGQNRSREDRLGMLAGLERERTPDAGLLAAFIREHVEA